jgi:hypothetical protein
VVIAPDIPALTPAELLQSQKNVLRSEGKAKTNFHNYPTGVLGYVNGCEGDAGTAIFYLRSANIVVSAGFYHDVVSPETALGLLPSA